MVECRVVHVGFGYGVVSKENYPSAYPIVFNPEFVKKKVKRKELVRFEEA